MLVLKSAVTPYCDAYVRSTVLLNPAGSAAARTFRQSSTAYRAVYVNNNSNSLSLIVLAELTPNGCN